MDGRVNICSCNIGTSTIRGGRISQGARDGGAIMPAPKAITLHILKAYAKFTQPSGIA
jgi:hypothetical protein